MTDIMSIVLKWFLGVLLAFVVLKVLVLWLQPRLAFYPRRGPTPPPPPLTQFEVTTEDGATLTGWFMPSDSSKPVIIYFCGNAGNLSDRTDLLSRFAGEDVTLVAFNYRGMGESSGAPTEEGVYRDAIAIYRHVTETMKVSPSRIVFWGHSIGGAVAAWLATQKPCAGLILESSFRSAKVMASRILPVLPLGWFMTYHLDNEEHMRQLTVPVLLIHGLEDNVVPVDDGRFLYNAAHDPKELWLIPRGGHNDLYEVAGSEFYDRLSAFARHVTGRDAPVGSPRD